MQPSPIKFKGHKASLPRIQFPSPLPSSTHSSCSLLRLDLSLHQYSNDSPLPLSLSLSARSLSLPSLSLSLPPPLTLPAVLPGEVEGAAAVVAVHQVHTRGARGAATRGAAWDRSLAVDARVARRARARVARALVQTRGAVLAQLRGGVMGSEREQGGG